MIDSNQNSYFTEKQFSFHKEIKNHEKKINNAFQEISPNSNEALSGHEGKKSLKKHLVVQIQRLDEQIEGDYSKSTNIGYLTISLS